MVRQDELDRLWRYTRNTHRLTGADAADYLRFAGAALDAVARVGGGVTCPGFVGKEVYQSMRVTCTVPGAASVGFQETVEGPIRANFRGAWRAAMEAWLEANGIKPY